MDRTMANCPCFRRRLPKTGKTFMVGRFMVFKFALKTRFFSTKIKDIQHKYGILILVALKEFYKYGFRKERCIM
jgi:hypothetical protein